MAAAIETTTEAIPTKRGDWFTQEKIILNCPRCEQNYRDRAMAWWDADYECWFTYLDCNKCGFDYSDVPVHRWQVEEWGRLGRGWKRADPDPHDRHSSRG